MKSISSKHRWPSWSRSLLLQQLLPQPRWMKLRVASLWWFKLSFLQTTAVIRDELLLYIFCYTFTHCKNIPGSNPSSRSTPDVNGVCSRVRSISHPGLMDIHFGVCDAANDPTDKQTEPTDCFFIPQTDLQLSKQKPETVSHALSVLLDYRRVTVSFITDICRLTLDIKSSPTLPTTCVRIMKEIATVVYDKLCKVCLRTIISVQHE